MVIAVDISVSKGLLSVSDADRIKQLLHRLNLPVRCEIDPALMIDAIRKDKKRESDAVHFILLRGIGDLERILARVALRSARPRDLAVLRDGLGVLPAVQACLEPSEDASLRALIGEVGEHLDAPVRLTASAGIATSSTTLAATRMTSAMTPAAKTSASLVLAPADTTSDDADIEPPTGMPRNRPARTLPAPWPMKSRSAGSHATVQPRPDSSGDTVSSMSLP